jgi:hypothetical protein
MQVYLYASAALAVVALILNLCPAAPQGTQSSNQGQWQAHRISGQIMRTRQIDSGDDNDITVALVDTNQGRVVAANRYG